MAKKKKPTNKDPEGPRRTKRKGAGTGESTGNRPKEKPKTTAKRMAVKDRRPGKSAPGKRSTGKSGRTGGGR
jgi:hypothetical protein